MKTNDHSSFVYFSVWFRLDAWLKSSRYGPDLGNYFQEKLSYLNDSDVFDDVFSGQLFKLSVDRLGGIDAVRNDVFLILSTDGVQSHRSTQYSYWPVI